MVSIAVNPTANEAGIKTEQLIKNNGFWPDLDLQHYRDAMRQDGTLTPARLLEAAQVGLNETHDRLAAWRKKQQQAGYPSLVEVPAKQVGNESSCLLLYRRAVYCLIQATVTERFRSVDATASGTKRAEAREETIDHLRRDAAWAIQDIQGFTRTTIELI
ncbi:head completion/stabilization protein [Candidatus Fukatsuia endosymbiont of Tuberolachnus salignus]|uniref:head completion/stabilization protein n=1 Tax=Candidatus Fukatsuia endosymbiont of Tuberolachnus salignus TaxID=3077957 RepID=UPI00313EBDF4